MGEHSGDFEYELHACRQTRAAEEAWHEFLESLPAETQRELREKDFRSCADLGITRDIADSPMAGYWPEFALPSSRLPEDECDRSLRDAPEADAAGELFRLAIPSQHCGAMVLGFALHHEWRAGVLGLRQACEMSGFAPGAFRKKFLTVWRVDCLEGPGRVAIHRLLDEILGRGGDVSFRLAAVAVSCGWVHSLGLAAASLAAFLGCSRANLSKEALKSKKRLGLPENLFGKSDSARKAFRAAQLERHWRKTGRVRTAPEWLC